MNKAQPLKHCPFCGGEAVMHTREDITRYTKFKKEIPPNARIVRRIGYPSGESYFEYREKLYIPQCTKTQCCGRTVKGFKTEEAAISAWNWRVG